MNKKRIKFEDVLREKRTSKGFNLRKFAELVGVRPTYLEPLTKWRAGGCRPTVGYAANTDTKVLPRDSQRNMGKTAVESKKMPQVRLINTKEAN